MDEVTMPAASGYPLLPTRRSSVVMVLALVIVVLGVLQLAMSVPPFLLAADLFADIPPAVGPLGPVPAVFVFWLALMVLLFALALVGIGLHSFVAAFGLWRRRPWARRATLTLAMTALVPPLLATILLFGGSGESPVQEYLIASIIDLVLCAGACTFAYAVLLSRRIAAKFGDFTTVSEWKWQRSMSTGVSYGPIPVGPIFGAVLVALYFTLRPLAVILLVVGILAMYFAWRTKS